MRNDLWQFVVWRKMLTGLLGIWTAVASQAALADGPWPRSETVELLNPVQPRSEEDRDAVTAAAWVTRGRIHQLRDERAAALACYQRAYFWDPLARSILPQIVLLASEEQHVQLAVRYAVLADDAGVLQDRLIQRQVAEILVGAGELVRGEALYRRSLGDLDAPLRQWDDFLARFEAARLAYVRDQPQEAAELVRPVWEFLQAAETPSERPELQQLRRALLSESDQPLNLLLDVFLESQQPDAAQIAWQLLQKHHPDPATLAYRQAQIHALAQRPEQALASLTTYQRTGSSSAGTAPYDLLAELIDGPRQAGRVPSAKLLETLEKWRSERPENLTLALYIADAWGDAGDHDQAIAGYRKMLAQQGVQEAYAGLLEQLIAVRASEDILDLLVEYLSLTGGLDQLGPAYGQLPTEAALAQEVLGHARRRAESRGDTATVSWVGLILAGKMKDAAEIKHWLQQVDRQLSPLAGDWLLEVAVDLILAEQYDLAEQTLLVGLRHVGAESRAQYYYYQCETMVQQGRWDAAVEAVRQAVAAAPPTLLPTMRARYGWILYRHGQIDEARRTLLEVTNPHPPLTAELQDPVAVSQARMVLSSIYAAADEVEEAEQELIQVLLEEPENINALNDLAYLWSDRGQRLERSLTMLQRVVAAEPDNVAYRDSLGWVYFKLGKYHDAARELQLAAAGPEPDGVILDHLGDALEQTGDRAGALQAWEQATLLLSATEQQAARQKIEQKMAQRRAEAE